MYHQRKVLFRYCVCLYGLLSLPMMLEAKETLTVEQAMFKCKATYHSQFEANKRLACFDSITTPAMENVSQNTLRNKVAAGFNGIGNIELV